MWLVMEHGRIINLANIISVEIQTSQGKHSHHVRLFHAASGVGTFLFSGSGEECEAFMEKFREMIPGTRDVYLHEIVQEVKGKAGATLTFRDVTYPIGNDYEYLVKFCKILFGIFGDEFKRKALEIRGQNGAVWFSENKGGVHRPRFICGADIYAASNFGTDKVKKRVKQLAKKFDVEDPVMKE